MNRQQNIVVPAGLVPIIGALFSIQLAVNSFFVKRWVDELDAMRSVVWQLRQDVVVLKVTVDNLSFKHKQVFDN